MLTTLPNLLTLSRIVVIPLLVGAFFLDKPLANWLTCALFTAAALTDFLDGYLARSWDQVTRFGRFLDPVADKIMVAAVLFMMVALGWIDGWLILAALVILIREILVSGLREFLAEINIGVPVTRLAKWKTALQMIAIAFLLLEQAGPGGIILHEIGRWGLWIAATLTIVTGYDYLRAGVVHMTEGADSPSDASQADRPRDPAADGIGPTGMPKRGGE
ncbi:MAG: CDP-diacylglycerol--glycerol-3-phosphate 3-phosphatidyltransferase [Alphaproteobacteria bacterium]|nr:CDP-diacylglycerol--glycerol-3-phosphate 3-phosphatidyltransferase [Alphaproteobacteria bacterium]